MNWLREIKVGQQVVFVNSYIHDIRRCRKLNQKTIWVDGFGEGFDRGNGKIRSTKFEGHLEEYTDGWQKRLDKERQANLFTEWYALVVHLPSDRRTELRSQAYTILNEAGLLSLLNNH